MQVMTTWSILVFRPKEGMPAKHKDRPSGKAERLEPPDNAQGMQTTGSLSKSVRKRITSTNPLVSDHFLNLVG